MANKISREELAQLYNIEIRFFDDLEEYGLLHTEIENNTKYLLYEELPLFEKFANWHYDLDINLQGLEVIHQMLQKMDFLLAENRKLMHRFSAFSESFEDYEEEE
ncbi:MAG: chaperone modulator CbpM [Flavobacteriaceae bacterium]|jgi:hypothetical protein|nr:chaperone modulator CbpM [Flavobacteriaceae bacterium]